MEQPAVFHVIFDGNRGGDWWTVINQQGEIVGGAQLLKLLRPYSITGSFHKGINSAFAPQNTRKVSWDFYADTIRWFASTKTEFWR